jgi:hypothetical protein
MVVRDSGKWTSVNPVHPSHSDGRKGLWEMDFGQSGAFTKGIFSDFVVPSGIIKMFILFGSYFS